MSTKEKSSEVNPYRDLPYLDSIHQVHCTNGYVTALKPALRNAINANRVNASGMAELINLLEASISHIQQLQTPKKKRRVSKPKEEKEYDLP